MKEGDEEMTKISIHASCGGSDTTSAEIRGKVKISIHASRGGSDPCLQRYL